MSTTEITPVPTTLDLSTPEAPANSTLRMNDLLRIMTEQTSSIFDEDSVFRSATFDRPRPRTATINTRSQRPPERVTVRPEPWSYLRPPRPEEYFRTVTVNQSNAVEAPPLERIDTRRPELMARAPTFTGEIRGLEPRPDSPYLSRTLRVNDLANLGDIGVGHITTGTINIEPGTGQFRVDDIGNVTSNVTSTRRVNLDSGSQWGTVSLGSGPNSVSGFKISEPPYNNLEQQIIKFLQEKLTLNVSLSQLSAGLELKVSLNLAETNETILSAEDFVELD